jgi:hypothetical protein
VAVEHPLLVQVPSVRNPALAYRAIAAALNGKAVTD